MRLVEYLGDSLSEELLSKFPHYNIASSSTSDPPLDFNYLESSIWSPLVKPHLRPLPLVVLEKEDGEETSKDGFLLKKKKISTTPVRNRTVIQNLNVGFKNLMKQNSNKKKKRCGDLFDSYSPTPKKRWANILKVGSKRFKKTSKKKDHTGHISLYNCFHNSMS